LLNLSAAFVGILGKIRSKAAISEADLVYIADRVADIRARWRVTSQGERFFALLACVQKRESLTDQQYEEMIGLCENIGHVLFSESRAAAGRERGRSCFQ
jgi:hypothetical protein